MPETRASSKRQQLGRGKRLAVSFGNSVVDKLPTQKKSTMPKMTGALSEVTALQQELAKVQSVSTITRRIPPIFIPHDRQ
jgi:restriction endonuclease